MDFGIFLMDKAASIQNEMSNEYGISTTPASMNGSYNSSNVIPTVLPISVVLNTLASLICVLGFVGNLIIAIVILKRKKMQTPTNWFVFNLAICDLAIVIITIPYYVLNQFIDWPFGDIGCNYLIMPTMEVFAGVCVLTHTAIGFARYAVISNIQIRLFSGLRMTKIIICVIWCVSYLVLSVTIMGDFELDDFGGRLMCQLIWSSLIKRQVYRVCVFILTYVIPMVLTGYSYYKIHNIVDKSFHHVNGFLPYDLLLSRRRKKRQMDKMLTVMYLMFAITTLPIQLLMALYDFEKLPAFDGIQETFGFLLIVFYLQILTNPFVLLYMGDEYRKELSKLWIHCCMSRRDARILLQSSVRTTCTELNRDGTLKQRKPTQYDIMVSTTGNVSLYNDTAAGGYNGFYHTPALDEIWQHKNKEANMMNRSGSVPCTEYTDVFTDDDLDGRRTSSFSSRRSSGKRNNSYLSYSPGYTDGFTDEEQLLLDRRISNSPRRRSSGKSNKSFGRIANPKFFGLEYKDVYTDEELSILDEQVSHFSRRRSSERKNRIAGLKSGYTKDYGPDYKLGDKMVRPKTKLIGTEKNNNNVIELVNFTNSNTSNNSTQDRSLSGKNGTNILNIDIHINTQVVFGNNKVVSRTLSIDEHNRTLYTIPEVRNSTLMERDDGSIYIAHSNTSSLVLLYDPDRETVI